MNLRSSRQGLSILPQMNCGMELLDNDAWPSDSESENRAGSLNETCIARYDTSYWPDVGSGAEALNMSCSFRASDVTHYFLHLLDFSYHRAYSYPPKSHLFRTPVDAGLSVDLSNASVTRVDELEEYIHDQLHSNFFPHLKGTFCNLFGDFLCSIGPR
ncbi:hypothetical protein BDR03DRAFT_967957 [Suillus americanus]|nr:hypothetical protein BDR03DRAFT_967957 [Suillus americanus]